MMPSGFAGHAEGPSIDLRTHKSGYNSLCKARPAPVTVLLRRRPQYSQVRLPLSCFAPRGLYDAALWGFVEACVMNVCGMTRAVAFVMTRSRNQFCLVGSVIACSWQDLWLVPAL
jgi:hypothetical protein